MKIIRHYFEQFDRQHLWRVRLTGFIKLHDTCDVFNFLKSDFLFWRCNIPIPAAHDVIVSLVVRSARACAKL